MNLVINSKNYNVSGFVKGEVEEKLAKLERYFADDTPVTVTIKGEKNQEKKVEITVRMKNADLRSEVSDFDVRAAIDRAAERIGRQLAKGKSKLLAKSGDSIRFENVDEADEEEPSRIVRVKNFALLPMTPDEACFQLELLEHTFFVFKNQDTGSVAVVYRRLDGDYGLIEPSV